MRRFESNVGPGLKAVCVVQEFEIAPLRVVILFALLLLTFCSPHVPETVQKEDSSVVERHEDFRVIIPKATWEPIFFKEVDERASIAKLPSLRHAALPKDDLETRLWIGFGPTALTGFDLKRTAGHWQATYIQGIHSRLPRSEYEIPLRPPKSGWEGLWHQLKDKGLLSLPDASKIGCEVGGLDGISYVVENSIDNTYRTYMYDNPQFATCKEAKQMIEIVTLFADEFGPQLPRY